MKRSDKDSFLSAIESSAVRTAYLFDFDGTICFSGEFSEDKLENPKENKAITAKMKALLAENEAVSVLTSRKSGDIVRKYLDQIGIYEAIDIHALGQKPNDSKGLYIKKQFTGFDVVFLYDDNQGYLDAAVAVLADTDIEFVPVLVQDTRVIKADKRVVAEPTAFHGSPYDFNEFSMDKMGTGDGSQSMGWGMYFSSDKRDAVLYSQMKGKGSSGAGVVYTVNLDVVEDFLLEADIPFKDQGEVMQNALEGTDVYKEQGLKKRGKDGNRYKSPEDLTGWEYYVAMRKDFPSDEAISKYLLSKGVKGLSYGEPGIIGTVYYVIFDLSLVKIVSKDVNKVTASVSPKDIPLLEEAKKYDTDHEFVSKQMQNENGFKDSHVAPSFDGTAVEDRMESGGDFSLAELAQGHSTQPADYFDPKVGARYYGYNTPEGMESYRAIRSVLDGKAKSLIAYRTVPKDLPVDTIGNGEWITFSRRYAEGHGNNRFDGDYKIIELEVTPDQVWWDGNDINEWGYDNGTGDNRVTVLTREKQLFEVWKEAHGGMSAKASAGTDKEYMDAVELGDMAKCQSMVDEAAKAAGYNVGPVYHGTNEEFTEFDPKKVGKNFGTGAYGKGFYFTDHGANAGFYGSKNRLTVYLMLNNPYMVDTNFEKDFGAIPKQSVPLLPSDIIPDLSAKLRRKGFDGVIGKDTLLSTISTGSEYVVYSPEQIKSADPITYDDNGEVVPLSARFNSGSKDIRAAKKVTAEFAALPASDEVMSLMSKIAFDNSFYDLYPGYSKEAEAEDVDYMFKDEQQAGFFAVDMLDLFDLLPDPIPVFRVIYAGSVDSIDWSNLGESWSFEKRSALAFGNSEVAGVNYLLTGVVPKSAIDWKESAKRYANYSIDDGDSAENEVVVADQSAISDIEIYEIKGMKRVGSLGKVTASKASVDDKTLKVTRVNPVSVLKELPDVELKEPLKIADFVGENFPDEAFVAGVCMVPVRNLVPTESMVAKDESKVAAIKATISRGDYIQPIVVEFNSVVPGAGVYTFRIIDGHHRFMAYTELKHFSVPCAIVATVDDFDVVTTCENPADLFEWNMLPDPAPDNGSPSGREKGINDNENSELKKEPILAKVVAKTVPVPSEFSTQVFYHGGSFDDSAIRDIFANGLKGREEQGRSMMAPVKNSVYMAKDFKYALIYAIGGNIIGSDSPMSDSQEKPFGLVFEVSGQALSAVHPDEDAIGKLIWRAYNESDSSLGWLKYWAENYLTPNQLKKIKEGEYSYYAQGGKRLIKALPPSILEKLMGFAASFANEGRVAVSGAYVVDRRHPEILSGNLDTDKSHMIHISSPSEMPQATAQLEEQAKTLDSKKVAASKVTASGSWQIPQVLQKNYKVVGDLTNIREWKAKTILANSGGKVGEWDDVGYVLIALNSNNIIPVARGDEHQVGYDLLYYLFKKFKLPQEEYVSVNATGANYLQNRNDERRVQTIQAIKKWMAMGGARLVIEDDTREGAVRVYSDQLGESGDVVPFKGTLSEDGSRIVDTFQALSDTLNSIYTAKDRERDYQIRMFNEASVDFLQWMKSTLMFDLLSIWNDVAAGLEKVLAVPEDDYTTAEAILFSQNGIKNKIHNQLRKLENDPKNMDYRNYQRMFGDVAVAKKAFDAIDPGINVSAAVEGETKPKFTEDDLDACWQYYKSYLIDILNGDYPLETAREDLAGLIGSKWDPRTYEKGTKAAKNKTQLQIGTDIEMEHKETFEFIKKYYEESEEMPPFEEVAKHIAENHLAEFKDYYDRLVDMEKIATKASTENSSDVSYVNGSDWFHGNRGIGFSLEQGPLFLSSSKVVADLFAQSSEYTLVVNGAPLLNVSEDEAQQLVDLIEPTYTPKDVLTWGNLLDPTFDKKMLDDIHKFFEDSYNFGELQSVSLKYNNDVSSNVYKVRVKLDSVSSVDYSGRVWGASDTFLDRDASVAVKAGYPAFLGKNIIEGGMAAEEDFPVADTLVIFNPNSNTVLSYDLIDGGLETKASIIDPIYVEARKYETAGAFVRSCGTPLYHGTDKDFTVFASPSKSEVYGKGVYLYTVGARAANFGDNVLEVYLKEGKLATNGDFGEALVRAKLEGYNAGAKYDQATHILQNNGFSGIKDGDIVVIFNPEGVYTKWQLTDIWNKANGMDVKASASSDIEWYRGDDTQFTKFDSKRMRTGSYSTGLYLTNDKNVAAKYGKFISTFTLRPDVNYLIFQQHSIDLYKRACELYGDATGKPMEVKAAKLDDDTKARVFWSNSEDVWNSQWQKEILKAKEMLSKELLSLGVHGLFDGETLVLFDPNMAQFVSSDLMV
jgi:hypothetical protein